MKKKKRIPVIAGLICVLCLPAGCALKDAGGEDGETGETVQIDEDAIESSEGISLESVSQEPEGQGRELAPEELHRFTEYVNRTENNGFLLSEYAQAEKVDLNEVLYNGAGLDMEPLSEEERRAYEAAGYSIETDVFRLTAGQIEDFLQRKMGIGIEDVTGGLYWVYLEESDSYVSQHGDTNYCTFLCTGGVQTGEEYELRCKAGSDYVSDCVVTVREAGDEYHFVSNRFAVNTDDILWARKIESQSFFVELNDWGEVEFVSLAPDILEHPMEDVSFELWREGERIFAFPETRDGNVRVDDRFLQVDAVAFRDYDADGYKDAIILCTYERNDGEMGEERQQEARIYKGNGMDFRYMADVSFSLNVSHCNQSISQVMEQIEMEKLDLGGLDETVRSQLEVFAEAKEEWNLEDYGPFSMGYTVYDLDGDGRLEFLVQVTAGTGLFSENHFYQVDASGGGIVELPQEYYAEYAELDIGISGFDQSAFRDKNDGTIYYVTSDVTRNGYAESERWDGAYCLRDGRVHSMVFRGRRLNAIDDDSWEETYFDVDGREISQEGWERLYEEFCEEKEEVPYRISWISAYPEDVEKASVQEILRYLWEAYSGE